MTYDWLRPPRKHREIDYCSMHLIDQDEWHQDDDKELGGTIFRWTGFSDQMLVDYSLRCDAPPVALYRDDVVRLRRFLGEWDTYTPHEHEVLTDTICMVHPNKWTWFAKEDKGRYWWIWVMPGIEEFFDREQAEILVRWIDEKLGKEAEERGGE